MAGSRENQTLKRWLSITDLEEYIGVPRNTIYHYVARRTIPFVKVPGSNLLRFDRLKIDEWLLSGAVETISDNLKGGDP